MEISKNKDKYNRIIGIMYSEANAVSMVDYPGNYAKCVGTFTELEFSEANFTESDAENGAPIEQQLDIVVRGQSEQSDNELLSVTGKYLILKLVYLNDKVKILGTPDNPVVFTVSTGGDVIENTLSVARISPEKAKYLV